MILVDTSAWVEYLRGTGSTTHRRLSKLIKEAEPVVTTDVVVMEILAGAENEARHHSLRRLLHRFPLLNVGGLVTYEEAAALYRACRRGGDTPRALTDCLIAAVAMRESASVLHADRDFDAIARHSRLRVESGS